MEMFVDGSFTRAKSGRILPVYNPATGKLLDCVPEADLEDVEYAIACAHVGQTQWAQMPMWQRKQIIDKYCTLITEHSEELAKTLCLESAKPITQARAEVDGLVYKLQSPSEAAKHLNGDVIPTGTAPGNEKTIQITVREPRGVEAAIIPFNFPVDLFGLKVGPALIMGNAVIVKPSMDNPLCLLKLVALSKEAGFPDGVLQCITGVGGKIGPVLASHPGIDLLSFTGSTPIGISSMELAAKTLKPCLLELGGNDAFIVLADADLDLAVSEAIAGRLLFSGQVCCASKRFLVHNSVRETFTNKLITALESVVCGDPLDPAVQVGPVINEEAAKKIEEQVNRIIEQGGRLLLGGKRNGTFFEITVLTDVPPTSDVAKDEEIFGPVIPIIGFDTTQEAISIANASSYGLNSCVFSSNASEAMTVAYAMQAGTAVINGSGLFRSNEMPFGGHKLSGLGTEGTLTSLEECSQLKTIVLKNIIV